MVLRATEIIFTIATVAIVLTHAPQFTTAVLGLANAYSGAVYGLQGRAGKPGVIRS